MLLQLVIYCKSGVEYLFPMKGHFDSHFPLPGPTVPCPGLCFPSWYIVHFYIVHSVGTRNIVAVFYSVFMYENTWKIESITSGGLKKNINEIVIISEV